MHYFNTRRALTWIVAMTFTLSGCANMPTTGQHETQANADTSSSVPDDIQTQVKQLFGALGKLFEQPDAEFTRLVEQNRWDEARAYYQQHREQLGDTPDVRAAIKQLAAHEDAARKNLQQALDKEQQLKSKTGFALLTAMKENPTILSRMNSKAAALRQQLQAYDLGSWPHDSLQQIEQNAREQGLETLVLLEWHGPWHTEGVTTYGKQAGKFISGKQRRDNPAYQRAQDDVRDAEQALQAAQKADADTKNAMRQSAQSGSRGLLAFSAITASFGSALSISAQSDLRQAQSTLASTPRTIDEPILQDYQRETQIRQIIVNSGITLRKLDLNSKKWTAVRSSKTHKGQMQGISKCMKEDPECSAIGPHAVESWVQAEVSSAIDSINLKASDAEHSSPTLRGQLASLEQARKSDEAFFDKETKTQASSLKKKILAPPKSAVSTVGETREFVTADGFDFYIEEYPRPDSNSGETMVQVVANGGPCRAVGLDSMVISISYAVTASKPEFLQKFNMMGRTKNVYGDRDLTADITNYYRDYPRQTEYFRKLYEDYKRINHKETETLKRSYEISQCLGSSHMQYGYAMHNWAKKNQKMIKNRCVAWAKKLKGAYLCD